MISTVLRNLKKFFQKFPSYGVKSGSTRYNLIHAKRAGAPSLPHGMLPASMEYRHIGYFLLHKTEGALITMADYERVTVIGGVTWIGDARKTKDGKTVVNIGVVVGFDKRNEDGTWEQNGNGKYYESLTLYGKLADHAIETFKPGDRIIASGDRVPKPDYTDKNGVEHTDENQINVRAIGPNIQTSAWTRDRSNSGNGGSSRPQQKAAPAPKAAPKPAAKQFDDDDEW